MKKTAKSKSQVKEFGFTISAPLEVRFDLPYFDEQLEKCAKKLGYRIKCGGGGSGGEYYDYSLYIKCQYRDEAERARKDLRKSAWEWLKSNWNQKLLLREMPTESATEIEAE